MLLQTCVGTQHDNMEYPLSTSSSSDTYTTEACDQTPVVQSILTNL